VEGRPRHAATRTTALRPVVRHHRRAGGCLLAPYGGDWVATTRKDGAPHAKPVWGLWQNDALWFGCAANSVTGRNLARDPRIAVHLESGDDTVILEGRVQVIAPTPELVLDYNRKYAQPDDQEAEGAAWYRFAPSVALTWLESDFLKTAARWVFD
jgi:hypothetical protein